MLSNNDEPYLGPGAGVHDTLEALLSAKAGVQGPGHVLDTGGVMDAELDLPGHWVRPKPVIRAADIVTCTQLVNIQSLLLLLTDLHHVVLSGQS